MYQLAQMYLVVVMYLITVFITMILVQGIVYRLTKFSVSNKKINYINSLSILILA